MSTSAGGTGRPANGSQSVWRALTASQLGAVHLAAGLPNQDAVAARQVAANALVAAVADGHGHHRHFRSARGSALAVTVACDAAQELAGRLNEFAGAQQIESEVRSVLVPAIVGRWRERVRDDLASDPFTPEEEASRAANDDALIAYGSTLLVAVARQNWLVLAQIGDGDVVAIRPDGQALIPVPGDPSLDGRQTTSLCGPRAEEEFRSVVVDTAKMPLLAVLLATDGYGNAQVADPWTDAVSADLAELIRDRSPGWLAGQLPMWASRCASADGSADDTTIALLIAPDAAVQRPESTTAPSGEELPEAAARRLAGPLASASGQMSAERERRLAKSAVWAGVESTTEPTAELSAPAAPAGHAAAPPRYAGGPSPAGDAAAPPRYAGGPSPAGDAAAPPRYAGGPSAAGDAAAPPRSAGGPPSASSGPPLAASVGTPLPPAGNLEIPATPPRGRYLRFALIAAVIILVAAALVLVLTRHKPAAHVAAPASCRPPTALIGKPVIGLAITACDTSTGRVVQISIKGLPNASRIALQAGNSIFVLVSNELWWRPIGKHGASWADLGQVPSGVPQGLCVTHDSVIVVANTSTGAHPKSSWEQVTVSASSPDKVGPRSHVAGNTCANGLSQ
jgi:hypothetical protein